MAKAQHIKVCSFCGKTAEKPEGMKLSKFMRSSRCSRRCSRLATMVIRPLAERFWSYVDQSGGLFGCWPWTGHLNPYGYGEITRAGKGSGGIKASRLSWELHNGPIPDGLFVCHTCDNPACVNPAHLFLGTPADNIADAAAKGRMSRGSKRWAAKLDEQKVADILRRVRAGEKQAALAREYGVEPNIINGIIKGRSWKHVNRE